MKILALDFSTAVRCVALAEVEAGQFRLLASAEERHGQSTQAFALIEAVLTRAGVSRDAVDRLAVGLGPGSYAGIRVSLAIVQGWQLARGTTSVGVSSVDCLAATAWEQGRRGPASFVVDAQRGEYYLAEFILADASVGEGSSLEIVPRTQIETRLASGAQVFGPEAMASFPTAKDLFPSAGVLARLAAERNEPVAADQLEPIYLRAANFVKAPAPALRF